MTGRRDLLRARLGRVGVWSFALQMKLVSEEQSALATYQASRLLGRLVPGEHRQQGGDVPRRCPPGRQSGNGRRHGDRKHLRAGRCRDGQRRPDAGRGVPRAVRAGDRREPRPVGGGARRYLRSAGPDDGRLPRCDGRGRVRRTRRTPIVHRSCWRRWGPGCWSWPASEQTARTPTSSRWSTPGWRASGWDLKASSRSR